MVAVLSGCYSVSARSYRERYATTTRSSYQVDRYCTLMKRKELQAKLQAGKFLTQLMLGSRAPHNSRGTSGHRDLMKVGCYQVGYGTKGLVLPIIIPVLPAMVAST